jgi:hypothetical protein
MVGASRLIKRHPTIACSPTIASKAAASSLAQPRSGGSSAQVKAGSIGRNINKPEKLMSGTQKRDAVQQGVAKGFWPWRCGE